ncbi:hypothetical protein [Curtobacterium sp. MCLR17_043]|nr:hypothetical protein [Curtobacterium sp. MCLR17_043]
MNTNTNRATEYTGDDKERAKRPLTVQEQARAMRREGLMDQRSKSGEARR